jgi:hypothetical protein
MYVPDPTSQTHRQYSRDGHNLTHGIQPRNALVLLSITDAVKDRRSHAHVPRESGIMNIIVLSVQWNQREALFIQFIKN